MTPDPAGATGENVGMDERRSVDGRREVFFEPVGEMEGGLFRHALDPLQKLPGAGPADLDAAEQIRFGARHLENALGPEMCLRAKDVWIGPETHLRAAPVGDATEPLQLSFRLAALEHHSMQRLLARDLYLHALGQRIGDRDAYAVQTARRAVHFRSKLSTGVQRAHDHFKR